MVGCRPTFFRREKKLCLLLVVLSLATVLVIWISNSTHPTNTRSSSLLQPDPTVQEGPYITLKNYTSTESSISVGGIVVNLYKKTALQNTPPKKTTEGNGRSENETGHSNHPSVNSGAERDRESDTKTSKNTSNEVFITVRSSGPSHVERVSLIWKTWMQSLMPSDVCLVTDRSDNFTKEMLESGYCVDVTSCITSHVKQGLSCKIGHEFLKFYEKMEENYKWFCHVDDDTYVNVPELKKTLVALYNHKPQYAGHYPRYHIQRYKDGVPVGIHQIEAFPKAKTGFFLYATGQIFCVNAELLNISSAYIKGVENFVSFALRTRYPDDLAIGFIFDCLAGVKMTEVPSMRSHEEDLRKIPSSSLMTQVTIAYEGENIIQIPNANFSLADDKTRFLSYHCLIHPNTSWCNTVPVPQSISLDNA